MKIFKDHSNSLISAVVELIVGVLLLLNPTGFTSAIVIGFGVLLVAAGILSIIRYFMAKPVEAAREQGFSKGLLLTLAGGFLALFAEAIIGVFPLLTMLYGVLLLVMSAAKLQIAVDMVRLKFPNWHFAAISAALSVLLAALVLVNPFETTSVIFMITAVSLIAEAVLDILSVFFKKKTA